MGVSTYVPQQVVQVPADLDVVTDSFDLSTITTADLVFAGCSIVVAVIVAHLVKRWLRRWLDHLDGMPAQAGDIIARMTSYAIIFVGIVIALEAIGFSLGVVGSMLMLTVVVVVVAARPLLQDVSAGVTMQLRRPFVPGDQVCIQGFEGRVEGVNARTVEIITPRGERVHLPNRSVLDGPITNLTSEAGRMTAFVAGLDYATDLDRAREVIVAALAASDSVATEPAPQAFVEEFAESTINVACRFWHAPEIQAEWAARDGAMRSVKRALDAAGMTIAFPQRVLWTAEDAA